MARPEMPKGYLGAQTKWKEWGLYTVSHNSPEITTNTGSVKIDIKTGCAMKVTANLIECGGKEQEYKELVFTQTQCRENSKERIVTLLVTLPSAGFYKLQIYALLACDDSNSLPNVYNYLIHSTADHPGPVVPFPKQFAQWKDGCYLFEPLHLKDLDRALFKVTIPDANAVALTVEKEWFPLKKGSDGVWAGEVQGLHKFKGKVQKAALNANFVPEDTKYTSLLEYSL